MPSRDDLLIAMRGLMMGGADIIPGVSGGTIALILGIYERLVTAISRFDRRWLGHIFAGRWRDAAAHCDLRFVVALGVGILVGIVSLASLMHHLLEHHRSLTMSGFFGLILASSVIVGRLVQPRSSRQGAICVVVGLLGAAIAWWIVSQTGAGPRPGLGYTFVCGMVAICAMILPGISGAYIMLLLGKYAEITGIIKRLPAGDATTAELLVLVVLAAGCVVGLMLFSRVLHWLLAHWHAETMALLCGFMLGSLRRIWPFQHDLTPEIAELHRKQLQPVWPDAIDGSVLSCLLVACLAFAAVILLDRLGRMNTVSPGNVES